MAAGHLVSADPVERVGPWKNNSIEGSSMSYNTVETVRGEGGWDAKELPALRSHRIGSLLMESHGSCEDQSSGQGAESH